MSINTLIFIIKPEMRGAWKMNSMFVACDMIKTTHDPRKARKMTVFEV